MLLARASPVGEAVGVVEAFAGLGVADVEGSVEVLRTGTDAEVVPDTSVALAVGTRYWNIAMITTTAATRASAEIPTEDHRFFDN